MNKDFLKRLKKNVGNPYTTLAADGLLTDDAGYIDTGSYTLNALISGSIYGGVPDNTVTMFAAPHSTGKTFMLLSIISKFLKDHEDSFVYFFESESAINSSLLETHEVDKDRVIIFPVKTIEEYGIQATAAIREYVQEYPNKNERPKVLICLDSLGMLCSEREVDNINDGKTAADMGARAKAIKFAFRSLVNDCGFNSIPMIITNHVYDNLSAYGGPVVGGGSGAQYAATTIITMSKSMDKDGTDVVGTKVKATTFKSRKTKEKQKVETKIDFASGLDRYYGLLDLAKEANILTYNGRQFVIGDKKYFEKTIMKDPQSFFTKELLDEIDEYCKRKFCYGNESIEEVS